MENKFYTLSYYTDFGIRMYLSEVGYNIPGSRGFVFEPGFYNARKISSRTEARNIAKAVGSVPFEKLIINKHEVSDTGTVTITQV